MLITSDPTYPLFPVFAFLGFFLVLIPLPWHFQAWNAGTCLYMIWAAISCLNQFVNSIVWHRNAINHTPVWCDISARLIVGIAVAIPSASLCINRRLYKIATSSVVTTTRAQKKRAIFEDLAIGVGIPIAQMLVHFVVAGHRFDIYEDIGCWPATVNVWLTYPLVLCWPLAIGFVSAVYCVLTLHAFWKRKAQFSQMIASNTSLTLHRYFRLMALATLELICTIPFSAYFVYLDSTAEPIDAYTSWADIHFNFSRVDQIAYVLWTLSQKSALAMQLTRWLMVIPAFVFFLFFGFAEEARKHYRQTFWRLMKVFGVRQKANLPDRFTFHRTNKIAGKNGSSVLPVFITKEQDLMRDSASTLSISIPSPSLTLSPSSTKMDPFEKKHSDDYSESYGHAY